MGLWPTLCILAHKDPSEGSEFVLCLLFLLLMYQSNRSELYSATCKLDVSVLNRSSWYFLLFCGFRLLHWGLRFMVTKGTSFLRCCLYSEDVDQVDAGFTRRTIICSSFVQNPRSCCSRNCSRNFWYRRIAFSLVRCGKRADASCWLTGSNNQSSCCLGAMSLPKRSHRRWLGSQPNHRLRHWPNISRGCMVTVF